MIIQIKCPNLEMHDGACRHGDCDYCPTAIAMKYQRDILMTDGLEIDIEAYSTSKLTDKILGWLEHKPSQGVLVFIPKESK